LTAYKQCREVGTFEKYLGNEVLALCINAPLDRTCDSELKFSCTSSFWGDYWTRRPSAGDDGVILDFPNPRVVRKEISSVFFVFLFVCLFVLQYCDSTVFLGFLVKHFATWASLPAKIIFCKIPQLGCHFICTQYGLTKSEWKKDMWAL
jgi:hypothetical protein